MLILNSILLIHLLSIGLVNCVEQSTQTSNDQITNEQLYDSQQPPQRCDDARLKCAFRLDCGQALTSYMIHCADLIAGTVDAGQCPTKCFKALIALAATENGSKLVDCECGDSRFCKLSKERVEVCRAKVEHEIADNTVVSCSTAKFICSSNTQCLTALTYYNKFCKEMFRGKYCSKRCLNSLNILQRQKNANKLRTCVCDGSEDFPCEAIKQNTEFLCLKKTNLSSDTSIELLNEDHRTLKHRSHHHRSDAERRHAHLRNRHQKYSSSAHVDQFETSPIDLDQIKNFKYFDIMISEALSSHAILNTPSTSIYFLAFFFNSLIVGLLFRF